MQLLQPIPTYITSHPTHCKLHLSKGLSTCTHAIIQKDAVCKSIQFLYDWPFKVFKHATKFFTIMLNGQLQAISLDQLTPAHLDSLPSVPACASAPCTTSPLLHHQSQYIYSQCILDAMSTSQTNLCLDIIWPAPCGVLHSTHCYFCVCDMHTLYSVIYEFFILRALCQMTLLA